MSYILDAIKKADQKRKLGEVPDLNTVHEGPLIEPRRFGWLYGLAALLFVNAAGLAWWLWVKAPAQEVAVTVSEKPEVGREQAPSSSPAPSVAVVPLSAPAVTATLPPSTPPAEPPAPQPVVPPAEPQAQAVPQPPAQPPQTVAPPQASAVPPVAVSAKTPQPRAVDAAAVPKPKPAAAPPASAAPAANPTAFVPVQEALPPTSSAPAEMAEAEKAGPSQEEALGAEEQTPPPDEGHIDKTAVEAPQALVPIATSLGAKEKAKKAEREEEDPELAKIPLLKQLPAEVQKSLPALHISFHSYSITPSARLVSISGKILRQGQEFDENLKLERITTKGVVLDFKGKRFRLDV